MNAIDQWASAHGYNLPQGRDWSPAEIANLQAAGMPVNVGKTMNAIDAWASAHGYNLPGAGDYWSPQEIANLVAAGMPQQTADPISAWAAAHGFNLPAAGDYWGPDEIQNLIQAGMPASIANSSGQYDAGMLRLNETNRAQAQQAADNGNRGGGLTGLALGGLAAYFGLPGILGNALGVGSVGGGALSGALTSTLTGGNPLTGALSGGIGGSFGGDYLPGAGGEGALSAGEFAANAGVGASPSIPTWAQPMASGVSDTGFGSGTTPGTTLADYAANAESTDLLQGQTMLNNAGIKYSDLLTPAAAAAAGGAAGSAAGTGGGGYELGGDTGLTGGGSYSGAIDPNELAAGNPALQATNAEGQSLYASAAQTVGAGGSAAGAATGAAAGAGGALSRVLNGTATAADYASLGLSALPGLIGAYASSNATDAYKTLAETFAGYGAPYRQKLSDLYADPSSFLKSAEVQKPVQMGSDILARSLSTQGNPIGSGNALQQLQSYSSDQLFGRLGQEKDRLAGYGGLTQYNAAAPAAASNVIGSNANTANALGAAASNVFNPPKTLAEQLAAFKTLSG